MPAQMPGAAGAPLPVAQQEQRHLAAAAAQAEPPAGGEIEQFGIAPHIGDHGGDGAAADHLLGRPQQFPHIGGAHEHQPGRIEPEPGETRPIGQAQLLRVLAQLQVENRRPARGHQALRLRQGKAQAGAAIADFIGEDFLHQPARQLRKGLASRHVGPARRLQQSRLALDIGNDIAQRGKTLSAIGGLHDATNYMNKTGTFRLRFLPESSLFLSQAGVARLHQRRSRARESGSRPLSPRRL
jgi:hypothetical protein